MKKLFLALTASLVLAIAPAMADQDTYAKPGTLSAQAGVGLYWGYLTGGIDIEGGANLGLVQVAFAPVFPVDFGVAGRVGFGIGYYSGLNAGAYGTASYSWKALGLGIDWVNRIETYLGLGIQILPITSLGLDGFGGNAYYFDKNLAVFVENGIYATVFGLKAKF